MIKNKKQDPGKYEKLKETIQKLEKQKLDEYSQSN
jgi:hypothetical protein